MIVILDASVIVSAALKPGSVPDRAVTRVIMGPDRLVLSPAIAQEYSEVLFRPKFARLSVHRRAEFLRLISAAAEIVVPTEQVRACSDPADDKYLSLALATAADVIVTGDSRHLLVLDPWRKTRVLRPADYLALN